MKTIAKTRQALYGLTSAMLLLATGTPTAHAVLDYSEPPDLTPILIPLGSVSAGLNTVSGSIAASYNQGVLDPGGDEFDGFRYTVPAGHIVTKIELIISNYTKTAGSSIASRVSGPFISQFTFGGNVTFPNLVTVPGGIPAGNNYPLIIQVIRPSATSLPVLQRISFNWKFNITVSAVNTPPTASFASAAPPVFHCTSLAGATQDVTINANDANNDPLTATWSVNNVVVATHLLPTGVNSDTLVGQLFGFGQSTLSVSVTDNKSAPVIISTTVNVVDEESPAPNVEFLPDLTGECEVNITTAPTALDECAHGDLIGGLITGTTTDPLSYTAQGTYMVTWTYTSLHAPFNTTTQQQIVIVKDVTPPTTTCPPDLSVAFGSVPTAATDPAGFLAQGGTITDNCDFNGSVTSTDFTAGYCPTTVTRSYVVTDAAGNESLCEQIITVNNLFAEDGILWLQPLARNGASSDTDPGADGTLKHRFKLGSTIPIKVQALSCDGNVSANANVMGKVVVFGGTDINGVVVPIDYNGVGAAGGVMDKLDGKLQFNLNTKKLIQTFKCYILQVTVTDSSTGESRVETLPLQSK